MNSSTQSSHRLEVVSTALPSVSNSRRWTLVGLLFLAALINYLDRATISVALPQISEDFALGPAAKGVLLSAFFWSYALMQVPMGWLADRYHLRWLYAGAFTLWSLACGLTGFAQSLAVLIALRIILGVGESIFLPGSLRLLSRLFEAQNRGLASGLADSGTRVGLAVGAPLIAWLTVRYGWRNMFFIVGFSALAWLLPWLRVFPSQVDRNGAYWKGEEMAVNTPRGRALTLHRNLLGCCLGFLCFGYYQYLLVTWLPDYLVKVRHFTLLQAGSYASLTYVIWALCVPTGGWIADRLIRHGWNETRVRKGMLTVAFSTGLLLIPAALVESATTAIALVTGASLVGLSAANILVIWQACAPPEEVGRWTGIGNFVGNIGGILSPLVTGLLISRTGSYVPGFALAPVVLVAGLLSYWFIVGELKPPARPV